MDDYLIIESFAPKRLVDIERENGNGTIEDGIECTEDGSENDGGEEADKYARHDVADQGRINEVSIIEVTWTVEVQRDNAGHGYVEDIEHLEEGGDHDAFLAFLEATRPERALYYVLIRTPKIEVVEKHSGKEHGEGNSIGFVADSI